MIDTPTFAVLGAVNHGKSSVAATLSANDKVRISRMPGETVDVQRFSLGELFVFFDTPGFQNARAALAELLPAGRAEDPLALYADFVRRHKGEYEFDAECRLFEPIVNGAGLIYVVDGSRPPLDLNVAEMELLRLTGAPRLAIINSTGTDDHVADWRRRLGQSFNAVREFNAMEASFADRIELLETLAGIEQSWKPKLMQAVEALRDEWSGRLDEAAALIASLLVDLLRFQVTVDPQSGDRLAQVEALRARYAQEVAAQEGSAHAKLIALFAHSRVKAGDFCEPTLTDDLFSEATWSLLGLNSKQLLAAGTVAGAAIGASADVLTVGHTLLAGSAVGAIVGGAGAFMLGKRRPDLKVALPYRDRVPGALKALWPGNIRLTQVALTMGPYEARNFPWIVLDRAVGTLIYVMHRAHARRDAVTLEADQLRSLLESHGLSSATWNDSDRKACEKIFSKVRRGRLEESDRDLLRDVVRSRIKVVSGQKRNPRS